MSDGGSRCVVLSVTCSDRIVIVSIGIVGIEEFLKPLDEFEVVLELSLDQLFHRHILASVECQIRMLISSTVSECIDDGQHPVPLIYLFYRECLEVFL